MTKKSVTIVQTWDDYFNIHPKTQFHHSRMSNYNKIIGMSKMYDIATLKQDRNYKNSTSFVREVASYELN